MKLMLIRARNLLKQRPQCVEGVLIFLTCIFVYLSNNQLISADDNIPNSLLALNWLENHTLHFDAFRNGHHYLPNSLFGPGGIPYFFTEASNGHLTSAYPIGTAIISFPLYVGFFIYLKLMALWQGGILDPSSLNINITSLSFDDQRQSLEKLAGCVLVALTTVIFYLLARLKFNQAIAWIATFIYAFATLNWVVSSQGLWQHTASNLALVSAMLSLFKANRTEGTQQKILLVIAGIFCGLLPGIRPTSLLFAIAILAYSVLTYRRESIFLIIGSASALLSFSWNLYYFGFGAKSLSGGYSQQLNTQLVSYDSQLNLFMGRFLGLLVSPNRGLFVFSPIALFAIPGAYEVFKRRSTADERLIACLFMACLALFFQYTVYEGWWGAIAYGSRFLVDVLPVVCYLIGAFLAGWFGRMRQLSKPIFSGVLAVFLACLVFSTFTQVVGAFSDRHVWDSAPVPSHLRLWDWQDTQISRHTKNLWLKINPPIPSPPKPYLRRLKGSIEQIQDDETEQLIRDRITAVSSQYKALCAQVRNTGQSSWFGYDTGLLRGRAIIKVRFFDSNQQEIDVVAANFLYISGTPDPGETAEASGIIQFPQQPGPYQMTFSLAVERMANFPNPSDQPNYELTATILPE